MNLEISEVHLCVLSIVAMQCDQYGRVKNTDLLNAMRVKGIVWKYADDLLHAGYLSGTLFQRDETISLSDSGYRLLNGC